MIVCEDHAPAGSNCEFTKDNTAIPCPYCTIDQLREEVEKLKEGRRNYNAISDITVELLKTLLKDDSVEIEEQAFVKAVIALKASEAEVERLKDHNRSCLTCGFIDPLPDNHDCQKNLETSIAYLDNHKEFYVPKDQLEKTAEKLSGCKTQLMLSRSQRDVHLARARGFKEALKSITSHKVHSQVGHRLVSIAEQALKEVDNAEMQAVVDMSGWWQLDYDEVTDDER